MFIYNTIKAQVFGAPQQQQPPRPRPRPPIRHRVPPPPKSPSLPPLPPPTPSPPPHLLPRIKPSEDEAELSDAPHSLSTPPSPRPDPRSLEASKESPEQDREEDGGNWESSSNHPTEIFDPISGVTSPRPGLTPSELMEQIPRLSRSRPLSFQPEHRSKKRGSKKAESEL